jgi:ubiquitin-conjugating enzyme E2 W
MAMMALLGILLLQKQVEAHSKGTLVTSPPRVKLARIPSIHYPSLTTGLLLDSSLVSFHDLNQPQQTAGLLVLRGGGDAPTTTTTTTTTSTTSSSSSVVMSKFRHLLRSLIQICERNVSPSLANTLQSAIQSLETILGVTLLPPEDEVLVRLKQTTKKKNGKKKKKTTSGLVSSSQQSPTEMEDSSKSSKKKKNKKSKKLNKDHANDDDGSTKATTTSTTAATPQHHLTTKWSTTSPNYRIQRELKEFLRDPPPNLSVQVGKNIRIWIVTLQGVGIYQGETFCLRIQFPPQYPMVPPSVYFLPKPQMPVHEHVYTNGDICLSLLGDGWRPTMTAQSIAVSILSILASAQSKSLPMDNARHAHNKPGQYQKDWVYHDDNC